MADIEIKYIIKLNEDEAKALKHLLGNMNNQDFSKFGIDGDDRDYMSDIFNLIPYDNE